VTFSRPAARALVVLPALTWQGLNPVDDTGDGLPATLTSGGPIRLSRPLAHGLPSGFAGEAALLGYLDKIHRAYQLTTDLGLVDGVGPRLTAARMVVLAGTEMWLPASVAAALRSYVSGGGHVVSFGLDSLRRSVTVRGGRAVDPSPAASTDFLGARVGAAVVHNTRPLTVFTDRLGIFAGTLGVFGGYQVVAAAGTLSEAGVSPGATSIVGYGLGRGAVVDVRVAGFTASLPVNAGARALVARVWKVLSG
jgi:hypothetical protein